MPPLITLQNIAKIYGNGNAEVKALWNVSLAVDRGDYCAIMGPSGSGKSTAMNVIGCLDRPTQGRYFLDGQDIAQLDDNTLAMIRNQKIGFVFQQFHLLPQLSALDNVALPMVYGGVSTTERRERAAHALTRVGLGNRLASKPSQLSGGQQQRTAIARAIVNRPLLLLADEPTGALDTITTREVMQIVAELNQGGITVVVVTHEPAVARLTKRVIWFRDGQVVNAHMPPEDVVYGNPADS
ncbi:MAG: ABC transporter ATP-binding protein [Symploca sp. SIO2G7]|nr:ABC transporter ATP-binding protein [Symploca sp. SIO2G7]